MKFAYSLVMLSCVLMGAKGYPRSYFTSQGNVDTWLQGDSSRGGMVLRRSYDPSNSPRVIRGGQTTYTLRQPESELTAQQLSQYHLADRRRQALLEVNDTPPQENEIFYPQIPDVNAVVPVDATELIVPTDKTEVTTTKTVVPEIVEPEIKEVPEPAEKPRNVEGKKQVKTPVQDEEDDEEDEGYPPFHRFSGGAFFPMFFGYGRGSPSGPTAIANAFSTGKGGAAASEAVAYANPRPEKRV
ncbi:unnamed protein product [Chrysodeixis includens]|uniref:Uncharacterized protein n=1 Tax=Chrysodeixis includens TaxID=689277 RepID=A0A9P0FRS4_CHRIL|nr:unnamed protein product [Chrysodeixis includens]